MAEFEIIRRLRARLGEPGPRAHTRIASGDDAAQLGTTTDEWLVTLDTMVQDVHWSPEHSQPSDVGFKLLAVNLSDIAAMGGHPGPFLLAMTLPTPFDNDFITGFADGIDEARRAHELDPTVVTAVGGDVTSSGGEIVVSMTLFGWPGLRVLRRDAARAGDRLWVSGPLGLAQAGLMALERGLDEGSTALATNRHRRPRARLDVAAALGEIDGVHAAIDLSDGLAGDVRHVLEASGVGATIDVEAIPSIEPLDALIERLDLDRWSTVLAGGEDFELLVTADPSADDDLRGLGFSDIGRIDSEAGLRWVDATGSQLTLPLTGYEHGAER